MPTYRTTVTARLDDGLVVRVQTDMTFYQVSVKPENLIVFGPGVEEAYVVGAEIPRELSPEAKALLAVLLWEDQV
jgi:hypothetical protein